MKEQAIASTVLQDEDEDFELNSYRHARRGREVGLGRRAVLNAGRMRMGEIF